MPDVLPDSPLRSLRAHSMPQQIDAAIMLWFQSLRGLPEHVRKAQHEAGLEHLASLGLIAKAPETGHEGSPPAAARATEARESLERPTPEQPELPEGGAFPTASPGQTSSPRQEAVRAVLRQWVGRLPGVQEVNGDLIWRGPCPFHPEPRNGLVVIVRDESVRTHCVSGCKPADILPALRYRAMLTCLAEVKAEPLRWLWRDRIPRGKLTVFDGPPGIGKSTIALDLAARLTTGRPMPGETAGSQPSDVILIAHEDGLAETVRPRLDAAGADIKRVHHLDAIHDGNGKEHGFRVRAPRPDDFEKGRPDYLVALRHAIVIHKVSLVIIDPFVAYLGTDAHKDQAVRAAMAPLAEIAEETGAAFLLIRHLRKRGGPALMAGGGAIGIIGAARAGLVIGVDPEAPDRHRILAQSKSNLGRPAAAWRLSLAPAGPEGDTSVARIEWVQPCEVTADALTLQLSASGAIAEADRSVLLHAVAWVKETLRGGAMWVDEFEAAARQAGINPRTLRRAAAQAGTACPRVGFGRTARCYRALTVTPGERPPPPADPPSHTGQPPSPHAELGQYGEGGIAERL